MNGEDDEYGQPRVKLDWRISDDDRVTMREAAFEFGRYLIRAEIGRLNVNPVVLSSAHPLQGWTALGAAPGRRSPDGGSPDEQQSRRRRRR